MRRRWIMTVTVIVLGMAGSAMLRAAESGPSEITADKAEPLVLQQLEQTGRTNFFVRMVEKADLAPASRLGTKEAKGRFVLAALQQTAASSQRELRALLDRRGAAYTPFYISNSILVRGGTRALLDEIAVRSDVARIAANHAVQAVDVSRGSQDGGETRAVEPNIAFVGAEFVWSMGFTGQGTVVAVIDTGLDEDHPAIAPHYRGCLNPPSCTSEDHNYNWWDATGNYPYDPWDDNGHGTFCTGVAIGDDGGANQIGMAPGAKTIHCKAMDQNGGGFEADFMECFQWNMAPWDLTGANPDPAAAPDVVNISWGYPGGGNDVFRDVIDALQASGILVAVGGGSSGPACASLSSPGDYQEVLTIGVVDHSIAYPGLLSSFSGRGPSDLDPSPPFYFPDVTAPGVDIRSSLPGGTYQGGWSGSGPATPHASGLLALMWSACPALRGYVELTIDMIQQRGYPLTGQSGSSCGGDHTYGPNNDWGYGTIDGVEAVWRAIDWCNGEIFADGFEDGDTTDWSATVP